MRILHTESSCGWGGQELRIINEIAQMQSRGHHLILACNKSSHLWKAAHEKGLSLVHVPLGKPKIRWKTMKELSTIIGSEKIEIVNTHSSGDSWVGAMAAKKTKTICIRSRHISNPIKADIPNRILYNWLTDAYITTGESLRLDIISRNGISPDHIVSVPSGVEEKYFLPQAYDAQAIRNELNISRETFLWGMTAIMRSMKGHAGLLDAIALLEEKFPQTEYVFIGGVDYNVAVNETVLNKAKELGVAARCHFLGMRDDVPQVLAGCNAFVLPSTRSEGLPQGLTQAMAMGLPVVATKVGGIPEVVRDQETGYLVEPNQPGPLAAAMAEVMAHADQAKRMALTGQQLIRDKYSLATMVDKVEAFYQQLLEQKRK